MAKVTTDAALDAFADAIPRRKAGPRCWVCNLKERAWLEKARREGRPFHVMRETLVKVCGYQAEAVTRSRLEHHFREHMAAVAL